MFSDTDDSFVALLTESEDESVCDYTPFNSKVHAMMFMLLNSPRPIGENNMKFIITLVKELDPTAPSLESLKKTTLPGYIPPSKYYSEDGVPFYMVSPLNVLKMIFGTPHLASSLIRYPMEIEDEIKELYQADKWITEFPAPSILKDGKSIFVNDFIHFSNSEFDHMMGKVLRFFLKDEGQCVYAEVQLTLTIDQFIHKHPDVQLLYPHENSCVVCNKLVINSTCILSEISAPTELLIWKRNTLQPIVGQEYLDFTQKHNLKYKHGDKPIVIAPVVLYSDDTSGNRSKQWNKFDCWCLSMAGLPISVARNLENIHFLCCSNRLTAIDMAAPLASDIKLMENGIEVFDAFLLKVVVVYSPVLCILCDNVRASELTNHLGSKAIRLCRFCMIESIDATDVGDPRSKAVCLGQISEISMENTELEKTRLRKRYGLRESNNPLFLISTDLFKCIPVEVLHTILLGVCKYMLRSFMDARTTVEKKKVLGYVNSFPTSGLSHKITSNICKYYKSFVGRDFKCWMEMAIFIVPLFVSPSETKIWYHLSKIFRMCYCEPLKRSKMHEYRQSLTEFVQAAKQYMPQYARRLKVHLLLHLADCMVEFGPTACYNTERFESFNGFIRTQNIFGNRQAPSRDIALKFSILEYLRFVCSGGHVNETFKCGESLIQLYKSPRVQMLLNCLTSKDVYSGKHIYQPGCLRKRQSKTVPFIDLECDVNSVKTVQQLMSGNHCSFHLHHTLLGETVIVYNATVSKVGNRLVSVGDYIVTSDPRVKYGYLLGCYVTSSLKSVCLIQCLEEVTNSGTPVTNDHDCPLLMLSNKIYDVQSEAVVSPVSVVHCCTQTCVLAEDSSYWLVEREEISSNRYIVKHDLSNNVYCLNIYCTVGFVE